MARYHFARQDTLSLSWYDRTRFPALKERYTTSQPAKDQIALVNNLFDTRYYYSEGFIEEGRNFWAGVEYKF